MSSGQSETLVRAALLGTGRVALPRDGLPAPVGRLVDAYPDGDPAVRLLLAAGLRGAYERAGRTAATMPAPPTDPATDADRPRASVAAGRHLDRMLRGLHRELLSEWLALAENAGWRVPEEYLPVLLQRGSALAELRPAIWRVIGRRGHWLASQNPAWSFGMKVAMDRDDSEGIQWEKAPMPARLASFRDFYVADPDGAIVKLAGTWAQAKAAERFEFLAIIADNPTMAAEAFLEDALDDKSGKVAHIAAVALSHLPQSRRARRIAARLDGVITLVTPRRLLGAALSGFRLEVSPPQTFDAAARRDGLSVHGQFSGLGLAGWLLLQLVESAPLAYWTEQGASAAQWIKAARNSKWEGPLLAGWVRAAVRQQNSEWARALLQEADAETVSRRALWPILPADIYEALVIDHLRQARSGPLQQAQQIAGELLGSYAHSWSERLAREVLAWLKWYLESVESHPDHSDRAGLQFIGLRLPPAFHGELLAMLQPIIEANAKWRTTLTTFLSLLEFRRDMHREFDL